MALQSSSLLDRELEEEALIAFQVRPSRGHTPQSRPSSRIEDMFSQLLKSQEAATRSLENKMSDMAYKQVEQIAEMSDLVDASPHLRGMS